VAILSEELLKIVPMIPHCPFRARHLHVGWADPPAPPHLKRAAFHVQRLGSLLGPQNVHLLPQVSKSFSKSNCIF
jgi:hypothetical protein